MAGDPPVIRAATAADLAAIAELQGSFGWPPETYLNYDCRVALHEGTIAGFLVTRQTAPGEREVLNLAVHPALRRLGIGKNLLRAELSRHRGTWFLEVRESNQPAINLYASMGFRPVGRRPYYYLGPAEAAIVMTFFS